MWMLRNHRPGMDNFGKLMMMAPCCGGCHACNGAQLSLHGTQTAVSEGCAPIVQNVHQQCKIFSFCCLHICGQPLKKHICIFSKKVWTTNVISISRWHGIKVSFKLHLRISLNFRGVILNEPLAFKRLLSSV